MSTLFSRLFGSSRGAPSLPGPAQLIESLPRCSGAVVIAAPEYSGAYQCRVIAATQTLIPFVDDLCGSMLGGNPQSRLNRQAFQLWLRQFNPEYPGPSLLPEKFSPILGDHVLNFVSDKKADVFCFQCNRVVQKLMRNVQDRDGSTLHSSWRESWACENGHLLYSADSEVRWIP